MIETANPAPCGSHILHNAHTYRTGFLWLNKLECSGSPWPVCRQVDVEEDFEPPSAALKPKVEHKHSFSLQLPKEQSFLNPTKTIWHCNCGQWVSTDREQYHRLLLSGREHKFHLRTE